MAVNNTFNLNPTYQQLPFCTFETCSVQSSFYPYRIQLAANVVFLAIFGLAFLVYAAVYLAIRRRLFFTLAFLLGLACETIGYVGRILSHGNQWNEDAFLMQAICLTIGPAFLSAGIYVSLARIVIICGTQSSRIPPAWYTRVFIPCDIAAIIVQAAGGGIASAALNHNTDLAPGNNIMIAGLAFQTFTMLIFILFCAEFGYNVWHRTRAMGASEAMPQAPDLVQLRQSKRFRRFLLALTLATLAIFWRSAYRAVELAHGWTGPEMSHQGRFIGFEGVMVTVAVAALAIFHPAMCLGVTADKVENDQVQLNELALETKTKKQQCRNEAPLLGAEQRNYSMWTE